MFRKAFIVLFIYYAGILHAQTEAIWLDPIRTDIIYFTTKNHINPVEDSEIRNVLGKFDVLTISKRFPNSKPPAITINKKGEKLADISNIYKASLPSNCDISRLCKSLNSCKNIQAAEPHFLPQLCYVPSDDSISDQYALNKIQAFAAWDLHRGDSTTIIGITDTGIDLLHPDLYPNIAFNYNDPINGIDDDNDGYLDNFRGWDTGDDDNDPSTSGSPHGTHISGIASAKTDNQIGIAGSGFNCRFLPIRIMNADGVLSGAYEGLVYAAEHGCKIINCSWGGYQYSEINAEIMRYASINMDCIVFCGAGNDNNNRLFYPASYPYAVSIGATDAQDKKADFSNFGDRLDLFAPGDLIISTWPNGEYIRSGGTSMSSPLTAGCAAILRSAFPDLSSQQILYQLKSTSDKIDTMSVNTEWVGELGSGRVNLFRALSETGHPAVVLIEPVITDNNQQLFLQGDTISLRGKFINYLSPANNVNVTISSSSEYLQIINPQRSLASLNTLDTISINESPFKFVILNGAGFQELASIRMTIQADDQFQIQTFPLKLNADFINIKHNQVNISIGSDGRLGISGDQYLRGLGIRKPNGSNMIYEGGIMAGIAPNLVINSVRGSAGTDMNWETMNQLERVDPFGSTSIQYKGLMKSNLPEAALNVFERVLADSLQENKGFIIVEYTFENASTSTFTNFYSGIFTDWDLADFSQNRAGFDALRRISYVHTLPQDTLFAGVQVLDSYNTNAFAFENAAGGSGGVNGLDGLSSEEKYIMLSNLNPIAGDALNGADIVNSTSAGPFVLEPQESIRIAFAIHISNSFTSLIQQAENAINYFNLVGLPLDFQKVDLDQFIIYPNPAKQFVVIESRNNASFTYKITDLTGHSIIAGKSEQSSLNVSIDRLRSGIYIILIRDNRGSQAKRLVISR
jgi:serine protease